MPFQSVIFQEVSRATSLVQKTNSLVCNRERYKVGFELLK